MNFGKRAQPNVTNATNVLNSETKKFKRNTQTQNANPETVLQTQTRNTKTIKDFSSLDTFCFGDMEGANITSTKNNDGTDAIDFLTFINSLGFNKLSERDYAFIFSGDLVDKGKYDIRLLKHMIWRNTEYRENTLLTMGNRDLNKLRMGMECFIVWNDGKGNLSLPWMNNRMNGPISLEALCDDITENWKKQKNTDNGRYEFLFDDTYLSLRLSKRGENNVWRTSENNPNKTNFINELSRIQMIYKDTLGAPNAMKNRLEEITQLYSQNPITEEYVRQDHIIPMSWAMTAITNMLMAFNWNETLLEPLGEVGKELNGLYIKYLQAADIIQIFKYNNSTQYGVVSHSGLPKQLSYPFGHSFVKTSTKSQGDLIEIINNINHDKNKFLSLFVVNDVPQDPAEWKIQFEAVWKNPDSLRYIDLCANIGVKSNNATNIISGSTYSPIVNHNEPMTDKNPLVTFGKEVVFGGNWLNAKENTTQVYNSTKSKNNDGNVISLNIFGHQPQGMFPTCIKTGRTTHVNLDISIVNGNNYLETGAYATLHIPASTNGNTTEPVIFGKIVLKDIKIVTQASPIPDSISYQKSLTEISRLPITISTPINLNVGNPTDAYKTSIVRNFLSSKISNTQVSTLLQEPFTMINVLTHITPHPSTGLQNKQNIIFALLPKFETYVEMTPVE